MTLFHVAKQTNILTVLTEIGTNFGRNSVSWWVAWLTYQPNDMALAASQPNTAWTVILLIHSTLPPSTPD